MFTRTIRVRARRTLLTGAAFTVAGVLIVGCSSQGSTSSSASGSVSAAAPAATPASSVTRVPMQTTSGGEFVSPTGNISCEVSAAKAYCQTGTPARSVTMDATGKYTTCTGQQCLGNTGEGTPTLAYGTMTGVGPFNCESAAAGVTCTAADKGFRISTSGITAALA